MLYLVIVVFIIVAIVFLWAISSHMSSQKAKFKSLLDSLYAIEKDLAQIKKSSEWSEDGKTFLGNVWNSSTGIKIEKQETGQEVACKVHDVIRRLRSEHSV
jgi:hypothetical protein